MSDVFRSHIGVMLQKTLQKVSVDMVRKQNLYAYQIFKRRSMSDAFVDFFNLAGPGLASEKPEGVEISQGSITPGFTTRVWARTFGLKLVVTEETIEDNKYKDAVNAKKHCNRAMFNTIEVEGANVLARGWNASYVWGDGLPLFSTSHTLPSGATYANTFATAVSPSVQALVEATTAIKKFPGFDGIVGEFNRPVQPVCPAEQWATWEILRQSRMNPVAGNFAEINVVNSELKLKPAIGNPFWDNTETNWFLLTNNEDPMLMLERRKPRSRTWVDNNRQVMVSSISARWCFAVTNPRCAYGSDA